MYIVEHNNRHISFFFPFGLSLICAGRLKEEDQRCDRSGSSTLFPYFLIDNGSILFFKNTCIILKMRKWVQIFLYESIFIYHSFILKILWYFVKQIFIIFLKKTISLKINKKNKKLPKSL